MFPEMVVRQVVQRMHKRTPIFGQSRVSQAIIVAWPGLSAEVRRRAASLIVTAETPAGE